jgi:hypothetical protein
MDDARVSLVSSQEVFSAEAYMLFYRVVNHSYSQKLAAQVKALNESYAAADAKEKENVEKAAAETAAAAAASTATATANIKLEKATPNVTQQSKKTLSIPPPSTQGSSTVSSSGPAASVKKNPRKRKAPEFTCGEEWARTKTIISEKNISRFRDVEAKVSRFIKFTPEFTKLLTEHSLKGNAKVGQHISNAFPDIRSLSGH